MNNFSEQLDLVDKGAEVYNFTIDFQKKNIQNELDWLNANYDNITALREYFLNCARFNNTYLYSQYAEQLNSYSAQQIHGMVEYRANILYYNLQMLDTKKIQTQPLKMIIQILKSQNN